MKQNPYLKYYADTSSKELHSISFNSDLYHSEVRHAALQILSQRDEGLSSSQQLVFETLGAQIQKEKQQIEELEEKSQVLKEDAPILELYSPSAIFGFSIFFSIILGGILMFINFSTIGKKKKAWSMIGIAILFSLSGFAVAYQFPENQWVMLIANVLGGIVFVEYFWKKHFALQNNYQKKSISRVLIYAILFSFVLVGLSILQTGELPKVN